MLTSPRAVAVPDDDEVDIKEVILFRHLTLVSKEIIT